MRTGISLLTPYELCIVYTKYVRTKHIHSNKQQQQQQQWRTCERACTACSVSHMPYNSERWFYSKSGFRRTVDTRPRPPPAPQQQQQQQRLCRRRREGSACDAGSCTGVGEFKAVNVSSFLVETPPAVRTYVARLAVTPPPTKHVRNACSRWTRLALHQYAVYL